MALVNGSSLKLLLFSLLLLLSTLSFFVQGTKKPWQEMYPFIKPASSFSSPSSSSSSQSSSSSNHHKVLYDYIIVGGGTAGCPLAATLSQKFNVLLLERGGVPFGNVNVSLMQNFHINLADISPTSSSQFFVSTDGVFNSRARVLGGGTCINAGFYSRADSSFIKEVGWDEKLVNESYPWIEKQIVRWPNLAPWQRAVMDSLVEAGVSPFNGFTYDHVYGTKVGGTIFDRVGRRHTAAELLATANPNKLKVLIHATVQKIVFDAKGKVPKAMGVIFKDENGDLHQAFLSEGASSDVILSSGAIGSPQLMLLSGIGPKAELDRMNIPVVLDNMFVGKGMADNPMNEIFVPTETKVKQSLIQTVGITKKGVYIEASSGFGQSQDSIHNHYGILSAGRTWETINSFKKSKRELPREVVKGGFILEKIARPLSTGHLNIANTNAGDNPSVTFNYFSHPQDVQRCVDGIRIIEKVVKAKPFSNYTKCYKMTFEQLLEMSLKANVNMIPRHTNDTKSLEQFCKDTVTTIWHYHGGCQVGRVVDTNYKVIGVQRLRIIDGSTFHNSPGTNPQATVLMMGRYMGVKILRERLGRGAGV